MKNWDAISQEPGLSETFMREHKDKLDWSIICWLQHLSEPFMEEMEQYLRWEMVSVHQKLSESFMDTYSDRLHWLSISSKQSLSGSFIEKHRDKISWKSIAEKQTLSEDFIETHAERLNWFDICKYQNVSKAFLKKHFYRIPPNWLKNNKNFVFSRQEYAELEKEYKIYWLPKIHMNSLSIQPKKINGLHQYKVPFVLHSKTEKTKHIDCCFSILKYTLSPQPRIAYRLYWDDDVTTDDAFSSLEEKHAFEYLLNVFLIKHNKLSEHANTYDLMSYVNHNIEKKG